MRQLPKNIVHNLQYGGEKIKLENFTFNVCSEENHGN